jgi:LuxR family maltose regulon positive regulatory protein
VPQALGNIPLAFGPLERALTLAEPEGYVRVFVAEGAPMAELLTGMNAGRENGKLALSEAVHRYIRSLLVSFGKQEDRLPSIRSHQALVEPLSQREVEVLRLIAQGLSNREIGERLFLSLNTVKGHNQKIFGKLQVQNRTEAVARARELGLL